MFQEKQMKEQIRIIPTERAYYEDILKIFNEGFSSKFGFVSRNQDLQLSFARDFNVLDRESKDRDFVAIIDEQVLGILSIRFTGQLKRNPPRPLSGRELFRKYGIFSLVKASLFDLRIRHKREKGELYIDTVAVAAEARGKGIGTALLEFTENFAIERGLKKLSLMVIYENPQAKALYERQGFHVKKSRSLKMLKRSTGVSGAYFMVKQL